jgi:hypothetical protein
MDAGSVASSLANRAELPFVKSAAGYVPLSPRRCSAKGEFEKVFARFGRIDRSHLGSIDFGVVGPLCVRPHNGPYVA